MTQPIDAKVSLAEALAELHANGLLSGVDLGQFTRLVHDALCGEGEPDALEAIDADQAQAVLFAHYVPDPFVVVSTSVAAIEDGVLVARDLGDADADVVRQTVAALAARFGVAEMELSETDDIESIQEALDEALTKAGRAERAFLALPGAFENVLVVRRGIAPGPLGLLAPLAAPVAAPLVQPALSPTRELSAADVDVRRLVAAAQRHADDLGHREVGLGHLLVKLIERTVEPARMGDALTVLDGLLGAAPRAVVGELSFVSASLIALLDELETRARVANRLASIEDVWSAVRRRRGNAECSAGLAALDARAN